MSRPTRPAPNRVKDRDTDSGGVRTGTVEVVQNIAGQRHVGTGPGAVLRVNRVTVGPASADNRGISVGQVFSNTLGIAMYFPRDNGTREGV